MNTSTDTTNENTAPAGPVEREQMFNWSPSKEAISIALRVVGIGVVMLGALGFGLSFRSVGNAAIPFLHGWAFVLPVMIDLGIAILTILGLVLALAGMPSKMIGLAANLLACVTLYLNCADQHGIYAMVMHGAGPLMWIVVVEFGGLTLRKLVGLEHAKPKIERVRISLWFLRPGPTFRLWRQMRIQQIRTYDDAIARDNARRVVTGRMRLNHGRFWRSKAPLSDRIALRLQGQPVEGVEAELNAHQTTANLLAGIAPEAPAAHTETAPEPTPATVAPTAPVPAQSATTPLPQATAKAPRAPRTQTPGVGRVRTPQALTDAELADKAEELERAALAASGGATGMSYRAAQTALRVGNAKAKRALDTARERINTAPIPTVVIPAPAAPLAHSNGQAVKI